MIKAIIMAGGEGTRLRPLTCDMPKPMTPLCGKPVLWYIVELLKKHDIKSAAATLLYLPEMVTDYFCSESDPDMEMSYFVEDIPLGTAGSVKNTGTFIDDTFVVISGDAMCDYNLTKAIEYHRSNGADATIILAKVEKPLEYGVVVTDENGRVERFLEKPGWSQAFSNTVNTGIYIFEKHCLDLIPASMSFDFSKDLFPAMMEKEYKIYGYEETGYWCDIGDLSS